MSPFLCRRYEKLEPYVTGEQPKDKKYIKLNANETSMEPSPEVLNVLKSNRMRRLGFYADPNAMELRQAIAEQFHVMTSQVFVGNGSDEVLGLTFLAFFDEHSKVCFPDITYGFYQSYAASFAIDSECIPLKDDFTVDVDAYVNTDRHIILANPNAPTGFYLPKSDIERMVSAKKDRLVIIDEAYIDYGNESMIPLIHQYKNLIVVHTMSKSKNLAGAHIGYCIADESIIADINDVKGFFNPFNLSELSIAIGTAAIRDQQYYSKCINEIIESREYTKRQLRNLGFKVLDSKTNFIFVTHPDLPAKEYNQKLREHGILARYYDAERINNYLRITIGTKEEMDAVIYATKQIVGELVA